MSGLTVEIPEQPGWSHVLVVGGTGMLRGLCLRLASIGWQVSVVARNQTRLENLSSEAEGFEGGIYPFCLDYRDSNALRYAIRSAEAQSGPIDTAVCWIHSTAPEAVQVVADAVQHRLIHILGSVQRNPLRHLRVGPAVSKPGLRYQAVILGYQRGRRGTRWLTHGEIVAGVLDAFESSETVFVVGRIEPWSLRPA